MKLLKHNKHFADRLPLALCFALPFLGMVILMAASRYTPFGNHAMLYSDMWHQYYPFFVNFRKMLLSGESLLFNWDLGLGLNYLGLMAYYLASPLNLLCVLLPQSWSLGFFMLLPALKMGFAGLFFGIFLKKVFRRNDLSVPLFSAFYALCAWAMGYQWNLMWLDSFALLPLVMLGMYRLLRQQKFLLYTIALFLAVSINYYIGFFICIFSFSIPCKVFDFIFPLIIFLFEAFLSQFYKLDIFPFSISSTELVCATFYSKQMSVLITIFTKRSSWGWSSIYIHIFL